ncbi:class I SAM-dependent methyltransferase [Haloferula sp. A504]|uniref:class I SAM-dependent methyltransferase n=1 Tax=Haloferula sp. A504 TaxID=3373601 RepID=UPI0031BBEC89|nr:class I SAM-dependent methyltransferase [Verrucomicrobiaceae bacterium E54]
MVPHPLLRHRYDRLEDKSVFVNGLFDAGAEHYDPVVNWGFLCQGNSYRKWALQRHGLEPGMRLLDVACGTGLVAVAAAEILGSADAISCVDPSEGMLALARRKLEAHFIQAGAEALPVADASFDFLSVGYALRHFGSLEAAFREFRRVLKPGGKVLLLEATKPENPVGAAMFRFYFGGLYPFLTRLFTRSDHAERMMQYFWETMDACVRPETILEELRKAGFEKVERTRLAGIFSEYSAE